MLCACLFTTSGSVVSWSSYTAKKDKIMSTAFYSAIFKAHIATIHSVRDIPQMGAVSQDELHKVKNRANVTRASYHHKRTKPTVHWLAFCYSS